MKTIAVVALKSAGTRLLIAFYILISVSVGFLTLYANDMLALVLNGHLMVQNFEGFAARLFLTAGLFILVFGMNMLGAYLHADFWTSVTERLTNHYVAKLFRAKYGYFTKRTPAELWTLLYNSTLGAGGVFGNMLRVVSMVITFVFYAVLVFRLDVFAGVFTVVAMPLYFFATSWAGKLVNSALTKRLSNEAEAATVTQESFENVGNVKAKGAYGFFAERTAAILRRLKSNIMGTWVAEHYISDIANLIRIIMPLLIIFATITFSPRFTANAGSIMILYINIPLLLSAFAGIHLQYIQYKMVKPYMLNLTEFNDVPLEKEGGIDIAAFESLKTSGVKVSFPGGRVVSVPDFEIKNGEKIMFFGASGIGKSTIFNIIMGLISDYDGDVLINGINLREIDLASIRRIFGIAFQHTNALTLDLRANILLGADKTDSELKNLIAISALESQHAAKGSDTLNNKVLSGGEKSRLGLAQMLAAEPQVMLIDETFSNVDENLESKIIPDLFREYPGRTVVCISHRTSSKPFFGRVVDFGSASADGSK